MIVSLAAQLSLPEQIAVLDGPSLFVLQKGEQIFFFPFLKEIVTSKKDAEETIRLVTAPGRKAIAVPGDIR
jgi:hypothetical protein